MKTRVYFANCTLNTPCSKISLIKRMGNILKYYTKFVKDGSDEDDNLCVIV